MARQSLNFVPAATKPPRHIKPHPCKLQKKPLLILHNGKIPSGIFRSVKVFPVRERLDSTDQRLVKLLSEDAQRGVSRLAEKMAVSVPTVRSRLRGLVDRNQMKIVGLLNLATRPEI